MLSQNLSTNSIPISILGTAGIHFPKAQISNFPPPGSYKKYSNQVKQYNLTTTNAHIKSKVKEKYKDLTSTLIKKICLIYCILISVATVFVYITFTAKQFDYFYEAQTIKNNNSDLLEDFTEAQIIIESKEGLLIKIANEMGMIKDPAPIYVDITSNLKTAP
ncbi:MAG: hypothetical protein LBN03_01075 [Bifidobacteriaceae bacterium]|jgi:hypothetical protein|nr:hypothetical protein [Bifidobacteriaceae bacterium]